MGYVANDDGGGTILGDLTSAYSFLARSYTDKTTGRITDRYGLYVEDTTGVGGLLTNQYGIYIEDMDYADTLNYAIYSLGGDVELTDGNVATTGSGRFDGGLAVGCEPHEDHIDICTSDTDDPSLHFITANTTAVDSGTTDGDGASKLIDAGQNFETTCDVGYVVNNTTDSTSTYITAVDDDDNLSLNDDIFDLGENYEILRTHE
ncbi:unnamed protein product, partial [marine sediment metagenome]